MKNIVKAIVAVMQECRGIEKKMKVGDGKMSYDGISDADVKEIVGNLMAKNGLVIIPTKISPTVQVDRWDEPDFYNGNPTGKMRRKQSVFTEVNTEYLVLHESGETMELAGYGHGVDSQDKSAGKATTYALKNTLLNMFLIASKKIEDTDKQHSEDMDVPPQQQAPQAQQQKPTLNLEDPEEYKGLVNRLVNSQNSLDSDIEALTKKYHVEPAHIKAIREDVSKGKQIGGDRKLLTDKIKAEIKAATTMKEVTSIFNENSELQSNQSFLKLLADKREQINPKKKSA